MTGVVLLFIGLLLLFLEFFLPGGVMGTAGALLIIGSVGMFISGNHGLLPTLLFIIFAVVSTLFVVRYSLRRVRSSEGGLYSSADQEGYVAAEIDHDLLGLQGEVLTDLKPSGHVTIQNRRYQAVSQAGYLKKGTKIEVIGGEGAHLTVRRITSFEQ